MSSRLSCLTSFFVLLPLKVLKKSKFIQTVLNMGRGSSSFSLPWAQSNTTGINMHWLVLQTAHKQKPRLDRHWLYRSNTVHTFYVRDYNRPTGQHGPSDSLFNHINITPLTLTAQPCFHLKVRVSEIPQLCISLLRCRSIRRDRCMP